MAGRSAPMIVCKNYSRIHNMLRPLYILPLFLLFGLTGATVYVRDRRAAPQSVGGWEADVLAGLGNTQPTRATLAYLAAWHRAEGGSASYNWLNTTQPADGATEYNSVGVKNYPSYATGIQATIGTLQNG